MEFFRYMICSLFLATIMACGHDNQGEGETLDYGSQAMAGNSSPASSLNSGAEEISSLNFSASCFLYHRFNESRYPSTNISDTLFKQQLKYLVENDYPVITLGELFRIPDSVAGKKYVILTIDDAFASFYDFGFPLLKKYGLKATLFVNTETIGTGDYAGWDKLAEMNDYGIEIGNHTHSHAYFLNEPPGSRSETFRKEVMLAQGIFKEKLGLDCRVFSYPFGEYDVEMQEIIREKGFVCAASQHSGVISKYADRFALPRFPMTDDYGQMSSFREKVNMLALPVVRIVPQTTIADRNPPELKVWFTDPGLDLDRMQGFVQGGECDFTVIPGDTVSVTLRSNSALHARRHLYTLTAPHRKPGKWYWFSHQWVFPDVK